MNFTTKSRLRWYFEGKDAHGNTTFPLSGIILDYRPDMPNMAVGGRLFPLPGNISFTQTFPTPGGIGGTCKEFDQATKKVLSTKTATLSQRDGFGNICEEWIFENTEIKLDFHASDFFDDQEITAAWKLAYMVSQVQVFDTLEDLTC
jgi:hypothetical protein